MNKILLSIIFISSMAVNAETIASCGGLKGQSYYPHLGAFTDKKNSGWQDDGITGGKTTITFDGTGFDILFVDTLGDINSSIGNGADIRLMMVGENSYSLLSVFQNSTLETYTFWKTNEGKSRYSLTQTKGGSALIAKQSVLVGECTYVEFDWLEKLLKE